MDSDPTESARRQRLAEFNAEAEDRAALEARHGQVWDTKQRAHDFIVIGFAAPYIAVWLKLKGAKGTLKFQNWSRFYFNLQTH